jgi:hypothetical protein
MRVQRLTCTWEAEYSKEAPSWGLAFFFALSEASQTAES